MLLPNHSSTRARSIFSLFNPCLQLRREEASDFLVSAITCRSQQQHQGCGLAPPQPTQPALALHHTPHSTTTTHPAAPGAEAVHHISPAQTPSTPTMGPTAGIVGAGFSGLGLGIKLQKAGLKDFTIFEAAADIGGTWQANKYPGCACDVQSTMYCFSFEPYRWSEVYSGQPEILKYLHHCADKHELWPHIKLSTRVRGARFDEDRAVWCLETDSGEVHEVQVLVLASGPLSIPTIPDVPGLAGFKGTTLHTANWDSSVNLAGKRVAVVGTGASAIQVIPKLQQVAGELVVFQRTPPWVLPRKELMPKYAVPAAQLSHPLLVWLQRQAFFWSNELLLGLAVVNNKQKTLKMIEALGTKNMKAAIHDPQLQQQLTPTYSVGCKRILASDTYYSALAQPNVRLVASGLKQVPADGTTLEAANGDVVPDVDVIVFATGFDLKAPLSQFDISARGHSLRHIVETKPQGYLGLAVAGFPNLFTLLGPNTGLGHHSVVFMAECQMNLIIQLLQKQLLAGNKHWVEVTQEAQDAFNREVQQRLQRTVWLSGCDSWYLTGAPQHQDTSSSSSNGGSTSGEAGSMANGSSNGTHHLNGDAANSRAGGEVQQQKARGGGAIMWPGLCIEFWWRTLWPVAAHWRSGTAAASASSKAHSNGAIIASDGAAAAEDSPLLQPLLSGVAAPDSASTKKVV